MREVELYLFCRSCLGWMIVSDIAIFVLKRDVKLQLTNLGWMIFILPVV